MEYETFYVIFISINLTFTFIIMFAACLCCRRKIPKNEFLGLEGMVKIKNPEENTEPIQQITESNSSTAGDIDLKRASNAPHRSLPDIPIVESLNDNGSELYATVADKVHEKPQGRSPTPSLKKQTSVSQHSSISQADDVSSPYARVKTPPHNYDKVLSTEHPYAQLNNPGQQNTLPVPNVENAENQNQVSRRGSNQSLLNPLEQQQQQQQQQLQQQEIPAASAIAGMVSASQELPYMTPPIVQQPHFSGDSQDSSKGYTSISVREPLANILANTSRPPAQARLLATRNGGGDSHYATVSDDSDEMYAAIDDPNNVYTSGSETYAQIQPSSNAQQITVSVEINTTASQAQEQSEHSHSYETSKPKNSNDIPVPPPVDSLRAAQIHSRQASSSSNTSSVCAILGSPKPEKRQANSPLPPTPKNSQHFVSNSNLTSLSSIPSGRNSVASVIECQFPLLPSGGGGAPSAGANIQSKENISIEINDNCSGAKKNFSPSKDIEGMYAKVIKKNKFSNASSQNSSPILPRKLSVETNSPDMMLLTSDLSMKEYVLNAIQASPGKNSIKSASYLDNSYETIDKRRPRCNSYDNKDHGYETIPAATNNGNNNNNNNNNLIENRKSDGYTRIMQKEKFKEEYPVRNINFDINKPVDIFVSDIVKNNISSSLSSEPGYESLQNSIDPGYETLLKTKNPTIMNNVKDIKQTGITTNSDYDPNYEVLRPSTSGIAAAYSGSSDDGYARVVEKIITTINNDDDGYSRVKERNDDDDDYDDDIPGYSKISERKQQQQQNSDNRNNLININDDCGQNKNHDYASIGRNNDALQQQQQQQLQQNNENKINSNNNDETGSDIYSSIPSEVNRFINLDFSNYEDSHNYQTICDIKQSTALSSPATPSTSSTAAAAASVTSTAITTLIQQPSSSSYCYSSTTKSSEKLMTTTTTTTTTPSTEHSSSPDTNHFHHNRYYHSNMKYSSTSNTLSSSIQRNSTSFTSSNYESLTGSESDPNYESVTSLSLNKNPYERLHNSDSNISPASDNLNAMPSSYYSPSMNSSMDFLKITPTTNVVLSQQQSRQLQNDLYHHTTPPNATDLTVAALPLLSHPQSTVNENGEVSDYFQV